MTNIINETLGKLKWTDDNEVLTNTNILLSASYKAKKFQLDQDIKAFLEVNDYPWNIIYIRYDNLSNDLQHKVKSNITFNGTKFSSFLIKDSLFELFELAGHLIDGWTISLSWHGPAYKSKATLIIDFSFNKPYEDNEGIERRKKFEADMAKEAENQKNRDEVIAYFKLVKNHYNNLGYQNGWSTTGKENEYNNLVDKAIKDKSLKAYATANRGVTVYISDRYKFYYYIDSTD